MTIAERKAREAHNRENPWRPMNEAKADGTICNLMFNDAAGHYECDGHYFLDVNGDWYSIHAPRLVCTTAISWRPAFVRLTPERRIGVKEQAKFFGDMHD